VTVPADATSATFPVQARNVAPATDATITAVAGV
jgi:hypothetical protein